jgi:hypothetical protein
MPLSRFRHSASIQERDFTAFQHEKLAEKISLDVIAPADADVIDGFAAAGAIEAIRLACSEIDDAEVALDALGAGAATGRTVPWQLAPRFLAERSGANWNFGSAESAASGVRVQGRMTSDDGGCPEPQSSRNE